MVFLSLIAEECVTCKTHGRWYEEEEEWSRTIIRHLFMFNPEHEKLFVLDRSGLMFGQKCPSNVFDRILKFQESQQSEFNPCEKDLSYEIKIGDNRCTYYNCQYVDRDNTLRLCNYLNDGLDYLLYTPVVYINPSSMSPLHSDSLGGGKIKEYRYPYYLPNPTGRISSYDRCQLEEITGKDFVFVSPHNIREKQGIELLKVKSWNEVRSQIVGQYLSGKIKVDDDEEEWYEDLVEEQRDIDMLIERGIDPERK